MRKYFYILILSLNYQVSFAQDYERKIFDYHLMNNTDSTFCKESDNVKLGEVLLLIENLQSEKSAILAKEIFEKSEKCPLIFDTYSWALFRSGKWIEAMTIIDSAITIYGSNPDLIFRRGGMNLEMAELGVGIRNIDGNSVYLAKNKKLNFDDSIFKKQNYLAALSDFKYLSDTYQDRFHETMLTGYIFQVLGNFKESTYYLSKLLEIEEYADNAFFLIVDNYIGEKDYSKAESILFDLNKKYPRSSDVQNKFSQLYEIIGDSDKLRISLLKAQYYSWVPEYCDLDYSTENYKTIQFFIDDNSTNQKLKKIKYLKKQDEKRAVEVFIAILNSHANHGNGIEEEIEKSLIEIGDSVVPKVILLMQNAPSTCTVTIAASVLAELKDPRGWQPMVDYLPRMKNIPITLIPPEIPAQIIKFDKEKGLIALLTWIKEQIDSDTANSDNPLDELGSMFASFSIYSPLSEYKKEEIRKAALNLKYTDKQIDKLIIEIFGKTE